MKVKEQQMPRTLFEKIWQAHTIKEEASQGTLLYIDRHLIHEVDPARSFYSA